MQTHSRRDFLGAAAAALFSSNAVSAEPAFPLVDYHVHLNRRFTLDAALAMGKERGVKLGILEHAGGKENRYSAIMTNDEDLRKWIAQLEGKPVYKGAQAEWLDWMKCFSKEAVSQLDYVLSDAMTMPGRNGERVMMWVRGFDPGDAREFMDRYVKWNVEVIETEPLDIFAHPTWLPAPLDQQYDKLWTPERMKPIVRALARTGTAVEIDSDFKVPRLPFMQMAKDAKLKFAFGSNTGSGRVPGLDFCLEMVKALGLKKADMFVPAPRARKPIMRRKITG